MSSDVSTPVEVGDEKKTSQSPEAPQESQPQMNGNAEPVAEEQKPAEEESKPQEHEEDKATENEEKAEPSANESESPATEQEAESESPQPEAKTDSHVKPSEETTEKQESNQAEEVQEKKEEEPPKEAVSDSAAAAEPAAEKEEPKSEPEASAAEDKPAEAAKEPEAPAKEPEAPAKEPEAPAKEPEAPAKEPEAAAKEPEAKEATKEEPKETKEEKKDDSAAKEAADSTPAVVAVNENSEQAKEAEDGAATAIVELEGATAADSRVNFAGKYRQVSCENVDAFFKAMGVNWFLRKMATRMSPSQEVTQEGDKFHIKLITGFMTKEWKFTVGEEFDEKPWALFGGDATRVAPSWDGDKLVMKTTPKGEKGKTKAMVCTREMNEDEMTVLFDVGEVVCKRVFQRKEMKTHPASPTVVTP